MIWDGAILSDMGMVTSTGSVSGQSQINIIDASHPMADGHSNGNVTIAATGTKVRWGFPTASADSIAEVAGQPNKSAIFAYQTGDSMNGLNAPHRRVGFFIDSTTPVDLNANGWGLFDAGVEWAINGGSSTYMPDPNQATATVGAFKGNVAGKRGASAKIQAISGSIQRISLSFAGGPVAVHVSGDPDSANNGLFHIYTDHLGSTGAMSDSSGAYIPNSHAKYTPFGDWRTEPTATAGDRYYTSHKHNNLGGGADDLGLIYMNARYYLPGVGRFASADTIVPDPDNPQNYNRYSYAQNNPVKYSDPTGHYVEDASGGSYSCDDQQQCKAMAVDSTPTVGSCGKNCVYTYDKKGIPYVKSSSGNRSLSEHPTTTNTRCTNTLAECFIKKGISPFQDNQINQGEFDDMLDEIAKDLYDHWTPGIGTPSPDWIGEKAWSLGPAYLAGRGRYDTPFYDGGGIYESDQEVCLGHACYGRSEVNYVAQGMWAAAAGDSLEDTLEITTYWNMDQYGHPPTEGELYWTQYGFEWYRDWLTRE